MKNNDIRSKTESVDTAALHIGDPVIITGNVEGRGETGTFIDAGVDGKFVVIRLHSDGSKHSYHSSDVSYYEHDDYEEESMKESKSILSEALKEISTAPDRLTNYNPWFAPNRAMASNKSGKYCLTRDNPPVRGKGFMCFGGEKDAIAAWKRLTNNVGVKIVRESAFSEDGTPLQEGEVIIIDPHTLTESRYDSQVHGRERWDTNTQGYQGREQGRMDHQTREFKRNEMDRELGHERNNYAVNVDGRQWKVFANKQNATAVATRLMNKYPGKKATVHPTGAAISEATGDKKSTVPRNFVAKNSPTAGAGQHKDKKRAIKQGDSKHKGKLDEQALVQADLAVLKKRTK